MNAGLIIHIRPHLLRIIGLVALLALLCGGLIAGEPMLRRMTATHVTIEALGAAPDAYLDRFVEMQGQIRFTGFSDCIPQSLELFELESPYRGFLVGLQVRYNYESPQPARVWGWIRRSESRCGSYRPLYLDITDIELLPATPATTQ